MNNQHEVDEEFLGSTPVQEPGQWVVSSWCTMIFLSEVRGYTLMSKHSVPEAGLLGRIRYQQSWILKEPSEIER